MDRQGNGSYFGIAHRNYSDSDSRNKNPHATRQGRARAATSTPARRSGRQAVVSRLADLSRPGKGPYLREPAQAEIIVLPLSSAT